MTVAKNLYKATLFGVMLLAIFAMAIPSGKVLAYQASSVQYSTMGCNPNSNVYSYCNSNANYGATGSTNYGNNGNVNYAVANNNCDICGQYGYDVKPNITTEPAIKIAKTSALVQGSTTIQNGTAQVWFEYGMQVDHLDQTTRSSVINPTSTGASQMLTSLTVGTKYFYRIVAHNTAGFAYGKIRSFITTGGAVTGTTTSTNSSNSSSSTSDSSNTVTQAKSNANSVTVTSKDSRGLSASVIRSNSGTNTSSNTSSGIGTFIMWLIIALVVYGIVSVVRMLQKDKEDRKKRKDAVAKAA